MKRRGRRRGLTLIEVMAGVLVLALTLLAAMAMFPLSALLRDRSGSYSHAAAIAQRKLEQIRKLPAAQVSYAGLQSAGVIDAAAASPYPFTSVDRLSSELTAGSGSIQLSGVGTDLVRADVTVTWRGLRGIQQQVTFSTLVASKELWVETSP
jgi:prepilin-type N-terminal cleavage/methylation domain-containing protein